MVVMMGIRNRGQAVVDSVRSRQAAAFKPDAAQVGVGFNHPFQRRRHNVLLCRQHRFFTLFNQRVVAQFSQRQRRLGAFTARHGGRAAAGAGTRFKPGRQRIADTGCQQACRGPSNDLRVNNHHVRVARQHQIAIKLAIIGIDDRECAARRIGRGNRRRNNHRKIHKMC